jgi:hypothetical protein
VAREIIWVHDKALNHSSLQALGANTRAIFIWDDEYFQNRLYSLKRLVFIYETLCQMPVEIIKGDTLKVIRFLAPDKVKTWFTADTKIKKITQLLAKNYKVEVIKPQPFAQILESYEFKRFFKYWNEAKKTAFLKNGTHDA